MTTQADWTDASGIKTKWLLEKTSLWGSGTGLDLTLVAGLGVAVTAILLIAILFSWRKKKREN